MRKISVAKERAAQGCFTITHVLTVHVVVVVVPVQRHQHLVLQLPGQDFLLISHLEGTRGNPAQCSPSVRLSKLIH